MGGREWTREDKSVDLGTCSDAARCLRKSERACEDVGRREGGGREGGREEGREGEREGERDIYTDRECAGACENGLHYV